MLFRARFVRPYTRRPRMQKASTEGVRPDPVRRPSSRARGRKPCSPWSWSVRARWVETHARRRRRRRQRRLRAGSPTAQASRQSQQPKGPRSGRVGRSQATGARDRARVASSSTVSPSIVGALGERTLDTVHSRRRRREPRQVSHARNMSNSPRGLGEFHQQRPAAGTVSAVKAPADTTPRGSLTRPEFPPKRVLARLSSRKLDCVTKRQTEPLSLSVPT